MNLATLPKRLARRFLDGARKAQRDEESGAAMLEFAVVFPAQLFFTLGLMQLALLMVGHLLVQHAAFAGARAALVHDVPDTGATATDPQASTNNARDAVAVILATIVPPDSELAGAGRVQSTDGTWRQLTPVPSGNKLNWPPMAQGDPLPMKTGAYGLAQVWVDDDIPGAISMPDYCACCVQFELPLIVPVVNKFFAGAGPYLLYGVASDAKMPCIENTVYPVITISKTGFVPRPWSKQQ